MPRAAIPPELRTAKRIAREGFRVTVEVEGVRYTFEPVDGKPKEAVALPGEDDAWDAWAARKGKP